MTCDKQVNQTIISILFFYCALYTNCLKYKIYFKPNGEESESIDQ